METNEKKKGKGFAYLLLIISFALIGYGTYLLYLEKTKIPETNNQSESLEVEETEEVDPNLLTKQEATDIGNDLWEYAFSTYWGINPAWDVKEETTEGEEEIKKSIECNSKPEDIRKKYSNDFIYFYADDQKDPAEGNVDDFFPTDCISAREKQPDKDYKESSLKVKEIEENKITFYAKSEYNSGFVTADFIIVKENDEWLIQHYFLPN